MANRMQQRRGTASRWTELNPVLAIGEIGFEVDTGKFKIGDGITSWNMLDTYSSLDSLPLGLANGIATLNASGKIPSTQLDINIDLSGYATNQAVSDAIAALVDSAPEALDTLNELAAALADDANFATTITNAIDAKANSDSPTITDPTFTINDVTTYVPADVSMQNWGAPDTGVIRFQIWDGVGAPAIATVGSTIYLTGTSQNGLNIDNINIVIDSVDDFGMYVQIILHAASAGDNAAVDAYLLGLTGNLSTVIVNKASTKTITSAELSYLDGITSNIQTQINNAGPISTAVSSNITLSKGKYFVDTTAARSLTLPALPVIGDEIQIFDASGTAGTNNITIINNSVKINGVLDSALLDVDGVAAVFVYTGSTYGWRMG